MLYSKHVDPVSGQPTKPCSAQGTVYSPRCCRLTLEVGTKGALLPALQSMEQPPERRLCSRGPVYVV